MACAMKQHLCDANVWVALTISSHSHHASTRRWLDGLDDGDRLVFCRATQHSFLRLITTRAVVAPYGFEPFSNEGAWATLDDILTDDRIALQREEPPGISAKWREFATRPSPSPKLWMDAYLAALASLARYRLVTTDRAFRQFNGLDVLVLSK